MGIATLCPPDLVAHDLAHVVGRRHQSSSAAFLQTVSREPRLIRACDIRITIDVLEPVHEADVVHGVVVNVILLDQNVWDH